MSEKTFNTRIQQKHDIEANWLKAVNFIPKAGELIIYDADDTYNYVRVKIGDGVTNVNLLSFITEDLELKIAQKTQVQIITWEEDD